MKRSGVNNVDKISFVVNLCPFDYRLYKKMLHHQYSVFGKYVDEFVIVYDENEEKIQGKWVDVSREVLDGVALFVESKKNARMVKVDYAAEAIEKVAQYFLNRNEMPLYDFRGAPVYPIYYSLFVAKNDFVMHIDSDMFFGGTSKEWLKKALELLNKNDKILSVSPLPGPPHPEKILIGQKAYKDINKDSRVYSFSHFSTRVFLLNKNTLKKRLRIKKPNPIRLLFAVINKYPLCETVEDVVSGFMKNNKLLRYDFAGGEEGLWSLHPQRRSDEFFEKIDEIINKVVNGYVSDDQLGYYDFAPDFFDWKGVYKSAKK